MDIGTPLRELGEYDIAPLRDLILAQDQQAWLGDICSRPEYESYRQSQSIVVVFTHGSDWPDIDVRREPGWEALADAAVPLMNRILSDHYPPGGIIIRAMAARLKAGCVIEPHRDRHPSFHYAHRIQIPVCSNDGVRYTIDDKPYQVVAGKVCEINNQLLYSTVNNGAQSSIDFIFDYIPPQHLGQTVHRTGKTS